jgi:hypothetical protein
VTNQSKPLLVRFYDGLLGSIFIFSTAIALGLSIRIMRTLTVLETMPKIKHIFFSALYFPGLAVILVYFYPKFKNSRLKGKYIRLAISFIVLISVSVVMGYLSGPK